MLRDKLRHGNQNMRVHFRRIDMRGKLEGEIFYTQETK